MDYIDVLILRAHGPHSNVPFEETIKGMKVHWIMLGNWGPRLVHVLALVSCSDELGVLVQRSAGRASRKS